MCFVQAVLLAIIFGVFIYLPESLKFTFKSKHYARFYTDLKYILKFNKTSESDQISLIEQF
jgi:hypothetical protein